MIDRTQDDPFLKRTTYSKSFNPTLGSLTFQCIGAYSWIFPERLCNAYKGVTVFLRKLSESHDTK